MTDNDTPGNLKQCLHHLANITAIVDNFLSSVICSSSVNTFEVSATHSLRSISVPETVEQICEVPLVNAKLAVSISTT